MGLILTPAKMLVCNVCKDEYRVHAHFSFADGEQSDKIFSLGDAEQIAKEALAADKIVQEEAIWLVQGYRDHAAELVDSLQEQLDAVSPSVEQLLSFRADTERDKETLH